MRLFHVAGGWRVWLPLDARHHDPHLILIDAQVGRHQSGSPKLLGAPSYLCFDEVFRGFGPPSLLGGTSPFNGSWPHVEIEENDNEIRLIAEVPGVDPDNIEVLLEDGVLTLRGENKSETEDKDRRFSERYYGRLERRLALGRQVDEDKVAATFKNGLLTLTLPKTEKARANVKRITIDSTK